MLWIEEGQGRRRVYAVKPGKNPVGNRDGWHILRGLIDEQGRFVGWNILPQTCVRWYCTYEEATQRLEHDIKACKLQRADCGGCWHLRNHGQTCDFFLCDLEKCGHLALRCGKCLAWGRVPPG